MADESSRTTFTALLGELETDELEDDLKVESVFALIRSRDKDGSAVWSGRSGGTKLSSEELLGAMEGLVASIRRDLANDWEW